MYALRTEHDGLSSGTRVEIMSQHGNVAIVRTVSRIQLVRQHSRVNDDGKQIHEIERHPGDRRVLEVPVTDLIQLRGRSR